MLVRHAEEIKSVRILIAGLDRLFEKANRFRPVGFGNGGHGDDFGHRR